MPKPLTYLAIRQVLVGRLMAVIGSKKKIALRRGGPDRIGGSRTACVSPGHSVARLDLGGTRLRSRIRFPQACPR